MQIYNIHDYHRHPSRRRKVVRIFAEVQTSLPAVYSDDTELGNTKSIMAGDK